METNENQKHGWVFYIDGSFRDDKGGWGIHGYSYINTPLKQGIGISQLPTDRGYLPVTLPETVTPVEYLDGFGPTVNGNTNNVAELEALLFVLKFIDEQPELPFIVYCDSEYTIEGYKRGLEIWPKKNWHTSKGTPVANYDLWQKIKEYKDKLKEKKYSFELIKIKAHSGEIGNDIADINARTGSGGIETQVVTFSDPQGYHKVNADVNPLFLKTRLLFNFGKEVVDNHDDGVFYYFYQLGRSSSFGHKQGDSTEERHDKSDLLLGRRISDATFAVVRLNEPDVYLEKLKGYHREKFDTDMVELAVLRLDNAYKSSVYGRIERIGLSSIITSRENDALITPHNELITKTLNPPRLAFDAVDLFTILQNRLKAVLDGSLGKYVSVLDITDELYIKEETKKKITSKLKKDINSNTQSLTFKAKIMDNNVVIKAVLGIDFPTRNMLAKIADVDTRVSLIVVANGPLCYSYAVVIQTRYGDAIFQSPYSQFVIPKKS